jgi:hypothetical protein
LSYPADTSYWEHSQTNLFGPLLKILGNEFSADDIVRAVGIVEVNNYELTNRSGDCGIRNSNV